MIVPDRSADDAYSTAERARDAVASVSARGIDLSCSAGVAAFPDDADDASSLCQLAEGALYWAKRRGKGRTRRFDPGHVPLAWTRRRAAEVTELLDGTSPITPVFQPVVALASGHLVGYEALSRFYGLAEAFTRGVVRPGATAVASGPTSRLPRSGPPSSRWGGRSGPTSRSTSARRR